MPFDQRFEVLRDKEDIHQNPFTVISYFYKYAVPSEQHTEDQT